MIGKTFPPAVVVHSLEQARMACVPGRAVTLLSAPGAAVYAGCLWWHKLLEASGHGGPAFLDCADAPGRALEALRLGLRGVILTAEPAAFAIVADIAAARDAVLLHAAPPALDLAERGAARKLGPWLG